MAPPSSWRRGELRLRRRRFLPRTCLSLFHSEGWVTQQREITLRTAPTTTALVGGWSHPRRCSTTAVLRQTRLHSIYPNEAAIFVVALPYRTGQDRTGRDIHPSIHPSIHQRLHNDLAPPGLIVSSVGLVQSKGCRRSPRGCASRRCQSWLVGRLCKVGLLTHRPNPNPRPSAHNADPKPWEFGNDGRRPSRPLDTTTLGLCFRLREDLKPDP